MSRNHPPIIDARYNQGLAAYRGGLSIRELIKITDEIDAMHEQAKTSEEHDEIAASPPSLIMGFAEGLIEDVRLLASRQRGGRA